MLLSVSGFPSAKTVQVRIYNKTTATEVGEWTSTGVEERANGEGDSTYYYDYAIVSGNEYIVDWKDDSTPMNTASEGISAMQSGVALETTLTAIKGGGWSNQTLKEIYEAILSRLASKLYAGGPTASSVTVTNGTVLSGDINDTKVINQKYLKIQETGKFKLVFEFTGLTQTESMFNVIYRYFGVGSSDHKVEGRMWNYTTSAMVDVLATDRDFPHTDKDNLVSFAVPGTLSDFFSGTSPNITCKIEIEHISNSDSAHQFWVEYIGLGILEQIYLPPDNTGILSIHEAVDSATYGLSALKILIDNMQGDIGDPSGDATTICAQVLTIKAYVDELEARLTATRAAKLDDVAQETTQIAEHDATQALINQKVSGSTTITIVGGAGSVQANYADDAGEFTIKRGDGVSIPFKFKGDSTGKKVYLSVKENFESAIFRVGPKLLTGWQSITQNGEQYTDGILPFTYMETKDLSGKYFAEIKIQEGTNDPVTAWSATLIVKPVIATKTDLP